MFNALKRARLRRVATSAPPAATAPAGGSAEPLPAAHAEVLAPNLGSSTEKPESNGRARLISTIRRKRAATEALTQRAGEGAAGGAVAAPPSAALPAPHAAAAAVRAKKKKKVTKPHRFVIPFWFTRLVCGIS